MYQSKLISKTSREAPADEVSVNAKLLTRAGFIDKLASGVYSYLPLGLRVLKKIEVIIREEMNNLGGQELLLPALQPKDNWEVTGRWKDPGREVMFQFKGRGEKEYGLGWTHEEVITPLAKRFIHSYKDLPCALYQIQTKFRDEPRAKSGLLRGREFSMKDMYSFHVNQADFESFYTLAQGAYHTVFTRMALDAILTKASGGAFSKYSHEFQVPTPAGEDIILMCAKCKFSENREIAQVEAGSKCPQCKGSIEAVRAIEVGNIFPLKTRFSDAFHLSYKDEHGTDRPVFMGCYGIGLGRVLGAAVEVHHDEHGIIWPVQIAPYAMHLVPLQSAKSVRDVADKLYGSLQKTGVELLYDDRETASAGEKLADADLIGIPLRVIISEKTTVADSVEVKNRNSKNAELVKLKDFAKYLTKHKIG